MIVRPTGKEDSQARRVFRIQRCMQLRARCVRNKRRLAPFWISRDEDTNGNFPIGSRCSTPLHRSSKAAAGHESPLLSSSSKMTRYVTRNKSRAGDVDLGDRLRPYYDNATDGWSNNIRRRCDNVWWNRSRGTLDLLNHCI